MATGWGVDATKNASGAVTSGTSAKDIRTVVSGMYNQGILRGCVVTRSSTDMSYSIGSGLVCNGFGGNESVLMPVYASKVTVKPNTSSSSRIDYVYVKQNIPTVDGNSNIVVGVTNTAPASDDRRFCIRKFVVPAGATKTSSASYSGSINYSTPYGQSGRLLVNARDTFNGQIKNRSLNDLGGSFSLTTDRLLRVDMTVTVDLETGFQGYDRLSNLVYVDGVKRATFSTGSIDQGAYTTHSWSWYVQVARGEHNITLKRESWYQEKYNKASEIYFRYSANGWPGQTLVVADVGVAD